MEKRKVVLGTLCYLIKDGKVLLMHRNKKQNDVHMNKWIGLGGKIEQGESPRECIIREMKEESGLEITNPKLRGILTFPSFADGLDWYVYLYSAGDFSGKLKECNEGELQWIDKDDVLSLPTWEGDSVFLELLLKDEKFFEIKFLYDNDGNLKEYTIEK